MKYRHFFSIFLWMIASLATNKNSSKKKKKHWCRAQQSGRFECCSQTAPSQFVLRNGSSRPQRLLGARAKRETVFHNPLSGGGDLVQCSEFAILGLFSGVPAQIQRMRAINHPPPPPRVDSRNCLRIVQSSIE
jgi:hypothetical protein